MAAEGAEHVGQDVEARVIRHAAWVVHVSRRRGVAGVGALG